MNIGSRLAVAVVAVIVISNSGSGSRGTNLSFLLKKLTKVQILYSLKHIQMA